MTSTLNVSWTSIYPRLQAKLYNVPHKLKISTRNLQRQVYTSRTNTEHFMS